MGGIGAIKDRRDGVDPVCHNPLDKMSMHDQENQKVFHASKTKGF